MVAAKFTRTKVGSMTLGERFRKIRSDRRISLSEVSRATKIQIKYLEAIEEGAYEKLPAEVYVKGFLRSYAGHLGVPEDAILRLYDRERHIQKNLGRVEHARLSPSAPIRFSFSPSPKMLAIGLGFLIAIGFFSYLYFELRSFVSEPRLVIETPSDGETVEGTEVIVSGKTDPRAEVRINAVETIVDETGAFSERVTLTAGLNTITVSSENRFGKVREKSVAVDASVMQAAPISPPESVTDAFGEETVRVTLRTESEVTIAVSADGEIVWNGEMPSGEERFFSASKRIVISADPGNVVLVRFRDDAEEQVSETEEFSEVIFGPEGRIMEEASPPEDRQERAEIDESNTE
jgi:cytoskeletal protein RodZ